MKTMKWLLTALLGVFLFASCGPTLKPFTKNMYDDYEWSERDLQNVQFYLSHDVVLTRKATGHETSIKDGKIRVKEGKNIEKIIIKRGTPGVLVFMPKKDRFAISFDQDDNKYLMFGPDRKANGRFVLLASDWNRNTGEITYDNERYYTTSESALAHLLVDIKAAAKIRYSQERATGRTLDD
jgi:hypothetical protein